MPNAVEYKGRTVNVGTIPIGIDPEKFTDVPLFSILLILGA
jgi:trehalose-6-phosphate synthase